MAIYGEKTEGCSLQSIHLVYEEKRGEKMLREKGKQLSGLFFIGDTIGIIIAFIIAYCIRQSLSGTPLFHNPLSPLSAYINLLVLLIPIFWGAFFFLELYQPVRSNQPLKEIINVLKASTLVIFLFLAFAFSLKLGFVSRSFLFLFWLTTILVVSCIRAGLRGFLKLLHLKGYNYQTVLIVGCGEMAERVSHALKNHPELGFQIIGFIDEGIDEDSQQRLKSIGKIDELAEILHNQVIDEVVFAVPLERCAKMTDAIKLCEIEGVKVRIVADLFERTLAQAKADDLDGIPLISLETGPTQEMALVIKKWMDIVGAFFTLVFLSPLFLLIAMMIKIDSPGSIFFAQERIGQNGRRFKLLKFRSMQENAEQMRESLLNLSEVSGPVFKIKDDPRVTKIGRFLRKTSFDELPQFINVLKGEMSLVGPRPPLPDEVTQYKNWQRRRLSIKPGITCIWQVSGRSDVAFEKWMEMDMEYIDNWSLELDMKILMKTVLVVLHGKGSY